MPSSPQPQQQSQTSPDPNQTAISSNMASQEPDLFKCQANDREATTQNAISLFHQRQFAATLDLFIQACTPPDQVLAFYPEHISGLPPPVSTSTGVLSGDDLTLAVKQLIPYLAQTRKLIQRHINLDETLKHPSSSNDTSWSCLLFQPQNKSDLLFLSLLHSNPSLIPSLLRLPNFCNNNVVRPKLWEAERYEDLLIFYTSGNLHREALELLYTLGKGDSNDDSFHGPGRTMKYLQTQLPAEESALLFEFARWPLEEDSKAAISIFTGASHIHPDEVLEFLDTLPFYEAEMLYLEQPTLSGASAGSSKYINRLVDLYISNGDHQRFEHYLAASLRRATSNLRTSYLVRNLALAQKIAAEQMLLTGSHRISRPTRTPGKTKRAELTAHHRCQVCQKRFSNTGAVKVMPSNDVVHWGCVKQENEQLRESVSSHSMRSVRTMAVSSLGRRK